MIINKDSLAYGVDISGHQSDWKPNGREDFIFIKATEGQSYVSPTLVEQTKKARDNGSVVGFYHFLWPSDKSGTPLEQAKWFVKNAKPMSGDLLVCDWEFVKNAGTPTEKDKDGFIIAVQKLCPGIKVGLYVNRSMWLVSNKKSGSFLWLAEYADNPTIDEWTFWQYTDKPIDQNVSKFNTKEQIRNWITPPIFVPPTTPVKKPEIVVVEPPKNGEDDIMARLSDEDIKRIAYAVWNEDIVPAPSDSKTNPTWKAASYLKSLLVELRKK